MIYLDTKSNINRGTKLSLPNQVLALFYAFVLLLANRNLHGSFISAPTCITIFLSAKQCSCSPRITFGFAFQG